MNRIAKFEKVSFNQFGKEYDEYDLEDVYDDIELPERSTTGSAGYDFVAPFSFTLKPGQTIKIPTGIRVKIDDGWVLKIYPRSGLGFKYGISLTNTVGIIDCDYYHSDNEGHIFVKMQNNSAIKKDIEIKKGDKFCQGIFLPYGITIDDDAKGVRNGGFGSTGK